jgi:hypothetical protein
MPIKLSKRTVDALAAGPLPSIGYDTELKGFGVRLGARASLSWFIEYRPGAGGRRVAKKRFYFGSREFTPEQARQTAKELLANVALGGDPMKDRIRERHSLTFSEFAERYLSEEAEVKLKPGTIANYRIAIRKHGHEVPRTDRPAGSSVSVGYEAAGGTSLRRRQGRKAVRPKHQA